MAFQCINIRQVPWGFSTQSCIGQYYEHLDSAGCELHVYMSYKCLLVILYILHIFIKKITAYRFLVSVQDAIKYLCVSPIPVTKLSEETR